MKQIILSFLITTTLLFARDKPNFVFINADDLTFRDLECYGGQAHSPNMNRLVKESMRFTHCFQAAPMCSPTRHNIYTGLYPVKSGAYPNHTFAKEGTKSVVQYLKPLGYRIALSGKSHVSPKSIFDFEYSGKGNNPDMKVIEELFIDSKKNNKPFCLFACSNEPHSPWNKGDPSRYPPEKLILPPYFVDTPETRDAFSRYLAEITYYDDQVGQILDLLDKHGLSENTLVMVSSEQGNSLPFAKWTLYDSGLQTALIARWPGKIKAASETDALVEYVDILPTFLDAAGVNVPGLDGKSLLPLLSGEKNTHKEHVYGIMTTRGINSGSEQFGIRSVRSNNYKLIINLSPEITFANVVTKTNKNKENSVFNSWRKRAEAGDTHAAELVRRYEHRPAIELYDINKDPLEWNNLAENPEYAPTIELLKVKLMKWMKSQGDQGQQTELEANEHQKGKKKKLSAL